MARVGSTNFQIIKMVGYAKEIDVADELDEKIQSFAGKAHPDYKEAFQDLQTAEESVKNLDKRLARFFGNYFY